MAPVVWSPKRFRKGLKWVHPDLLRTKGVLFHKTAHVAMYCLQWRIINIRPESCNILAAQR